MSDSDDKPFILPSLADKLRKFDQEGIKEGNPTAQEIIDEISPSLEELEAELKHDTNDSNITSSEKQAPTP